MIQLNSDDGKADLHVRVGGTSFGGQQEYATVYIRLTVGRKRRRTSGFILRQSLLQFALQLEAMYVSLGQGIAQQAVLRLLGGEFVLSFSVDQRGAVLAQVTVCEQIQFLSKPWLHGRLTMDQTYIPNLVKELRDLYVGSIFFDE